MDTGSQPVTDPAELVQIRRQARAVHIKAVLAAAAVTGILFII
jgi:hypothetical protein